MSAPPPAPATANPSPRALLARDALTAAVLLGVLADPLLRNEPWGLGLLVWIAALAAAIVVLARRSGRPLAGERRAWLALAVLFPAALSWHDADFLIAFDVLAMLAALVLLAMSLDGIPVPRLALARVRDLIRGGFGTGLEVATGAVPLVARDAELHTVQPAKLGRARRVGRALAITVPILLVFTLLLRNADPVFESVFRFPDVDLGVLFSHVFIAGFFAWVVAGWLRRALLADGAGAGPAARPLPLALGTLDVTLALGALNVLFAAFVLVQIGWLFGGEALVLRTTGLTYAAYARRGFAELTGVAALLPPVLLGAHALVPESDAGTRRWYRRLAVPLLLLLGAIMVSAGARMALYVRYYGISTDRLYASAFMGWLAIVFAWLALTVLRSRPRTFAAGMVGSAFAVLFALNAMNPDALVARTNLARTGSLTRGAGGADPRYVASLGGDAVPVLVAALTAPAVAAGLATPADRCAAAETLLERWAGEGRDRMGGHWTQWNVARSRAMRAVEEHEGELRRLACPENPHTKAMGAAAH